MLAVGCAVLAAVIANGYGTSVAGPVLGELRPVLVASRDLAPGAVIDAHDLGRRIEVRRVPASFVPPDALASVGDAVGRAPAAPLPAGSYLLDSQLELPHRHESDHPQLAHGLRPVEIAVTGADALAAAGGSPQGMRVDVVVTTEPDVGDDGRTFIAARSVELLALSETGGAGGGEEGLGSAAAWSATLALTRDQALRLIQAENFARQVRLMPHL